jgi:hypothetical protein
MVIISLASYFILSKERKKRKSLGKAELLALLLCAQEICG